jgi:DNA-binding CsgD family transcriptional regulator
MRPCRPAEPEHSIGRSPHGGGGRLFVGRGIECAELDELLWVVRAGGSRALVVVGEPGSGKTALLDYLVGEGSGCRVVRGSGVEPEMELVFGGLHQLCAPLLDRAGRLPEPQRNALRTALGLAAGPEPDRFLVGLAVLGLFAEAATERPLVCVIDDVQWLDHASSQALAFVARRLISESVAVVFAEGGPARVPELAGLPELRVPGLPEADARILLASVLHEPMCEPVLNRILTEARGNPLALLELPKGLSSAELALPGARGVPGRIEDSYRRRLGALPEQTRRLMLVAAAEPMGDPVQVWRATSRLGIEVEAAAPAAEAGLLEIDSRVRFCHPLLRSAVYRAASAQQRRDAHQALAEETDPEAEPEQHAWHAAQAAAGPDEEVAAELQQSAARARARGGLATEAAYLERAAELTPDRARRAARYLDAAQATHDAGAPEGALRLLSLAEAGPLDELPRARVGLLRGQIAFVNRSGDAARMLWQAAKDLGPVDPQLAREAYLEAISAARFAGPVFTEVNLRDLVQAVHAAPATSPRPVDLLLDGLATRFSDGYAAAAPVLKRALRELLEPDRPELETLPWVHFAIATTSAKQLCDDHAWHTLVMRCIQLARRAGAFAMLVNALNQAIVMHACLGELTVAASLDEERRVLTEAIKSPVLPYGAPVLAAWRGREAEAEQIFEATDTQMLRRGEGLGLAAVGWARALLYNGVGRYEDALAAAQSAGAHVGDGGLPWGVRVELIEAAARAGMPACAADALHELTEAAGTAGTDWALGIRARCRALLTDGPAAESGYREALERLGRTRVRGELARGHLLYGEWLRRENRRLEARHQLRTAYEMFTVIGAEAFEGRASRELAATGETIRKRKAESTGQLTAQEAQVVALVRDGMSNPQIGARLFISPRTVEWHLSNIFSKLHITSRRQLIQKSISIGDRHGLLIRPRQ